MINPITEVTIPATAKAFLHLAREIIPKIKPNIASKIPIPLQPVTRLNIPITIEAIPIGSFSFPLFP